MDNVPTRNARAQTWLGLAVLAGTGILYVGFGYAVCRFIRAKSSLRVAVRTSCVSTP